MTRQLDVRIVDDIGEDLSDALHDIYTRALDVLIIRGVFAQAESMAAVEGLEAHGDRYPWSLQENQDPRVVQMRVMGRTLTPVTGMHVDLPDYFAHADRFRAHLADLMPTFIGTLEGAMNRLSGGRPVSVARSESGTYTPATIRQLPPGRQIPVHCGNFFLETTGYRELAGLVTLEDQLSYFTPMQAAEEGGELLIYELEWGDPATPTASHGFYDGQAIERSEPACVVAPRAGDLLLFDGGRYFHKVSRVEGALDRWTIGGFVGFTKDMSEVLYWS